MHRDELINRVVLLAIGILTGVIVIFFRRDTPTVISRDIVVFQYLVVFVFLGMLPMLRFRATTPAGRAVTEFLFVMLLVVVAARPIDLVLNSLIAVTLALGSVAYFRFYNGSLALFLVFAFCLLLESWLFSLLTLWGWFQATDDLRFAFGMVLLTVILLALSRMFWREFRNISSLNLGLRSLINQITN